MNEEGIKVSARPILVLNWFLSKFIILLKCELSDGLKRALKFLFRRGADTELGRNALSTI